MDDHEIPAGEYIIPRRISRGYQLMPGVGLKDAAFGAGGFVVSLGLWLALHAVGVPFIFRGFIAVIPLIIGGALALPLDEIHVWEWLRDFRTFKAKPKTLYFDWRADDW